MGGTSTIADARIGGDQTAVCDLTLPPLFQPAVGIWRNIGTVMSVWPPAGILGREGFARVLDDGWLHTDILWRTDVVEDDHAPFHISASRQEELLDSDVQIGQRALMIARRAVDGGLTRAQYITTRPQCKMTFFDNLHPAGFGDQPICAGLAWWDGVYNCIDPSGAAPREVDDMSYLPPLMHGFRYLDSGEVTEINVA
ncbi:hypothetical protein CYMTET_27059 [Cymbomonas tetramitiformis]|uniref:Uncharacterized protein n=1 Tax=Cymbomonas tetramitiformis TaxID=36881 RepID=A0AAE0KXM1_9CHLO|nr:hypothetical protein CYMTET_27059 [Cymbomonas tetramitiformis]